MNILRLYLYIFGTQLKRFEITLWELVMYNNIINK